MPAMPSRRIFDTELHAHYLTFSCYHRRRLLDHDRGKQIVLEMLASELEKKTGRCIGFVIMPEHVHAIVWFPAPNQLSSFMQQWKSRSSARIKELLRDRLVQYASTVSLRDPVWQVRYYDFNLFSEKKILEKLNYMHQNPVRRGLVVRPIDWPWSSARHYELREPVGVPVGALD
jgi:putative transposase